MGLVGGSWFERLVFWGGGVVVTGALPGLEHSWDSRRGGLAETDPLWDVIWGDGGSDEAVE